ncbi:MAG: transglutaminase domain-containing protein, partial [Eggerthellaceae bacterium]|nr:transglutaminase domain-containing protein [Eggerthellaceae bacterium]
PINMGDGSSLFRVMQNTEGKNYVEVERAEADVTLTSEVAPFLIPNQICSYVASSDCVAKARELTSDSSNEGEAVEAICTYVVKNVAYDKAKAAELATATGYIPDPDETLSTGKGICFDYAALSAAMLRSMGLPAKVITGYVGQEQLYHAWIMVYIDGTWKTASFSVTPNTWSRCDVTFASTGATQYTGSGSSYTDRYTY